MNKEFIFALDEIEKTKNVKKEVILDALSKALVKSYQKSYDNHENVDVTIDPEEGDIEIFSLREVVEDVEDPVTQISLSSAQNIDPKLKLGDVARVKLAPKDFDRVSAQTARNIVIQKVRDAQRDSIYSEYLDRENEIITGLIQRTDKYNVYVNLDKTEGVVPTREQVPGEKYTPNERMKFLIKSVKSTGKDPQIVLSRSSEDLVIRLFELEVPEIVSGVIEIYAIAREAGSRTKLSVFTNDESVDCVGACIGFKGARVNSIVDELQGEKIDIINYDKDIKKYISNALSPAEIVECLVNENNKQSLAVVEDDQLSLAIGKEGQNARLAARLTGWKIDIKSKSYFEQMDQEEIDEILGLNEDEEEEEIIEPIRENSFEEVFEKKFEEAGEDLEETSETFSEADEYSEETVDDINEDEGEGEDGE